MLLKECCRPKCLFGLFIVVVSVLVANMVDASVLDSLFSSTESTVNVEDKVYLEDLANAPSLPPPNSKIENLSLSISFEKTESKDLYEKGVKRLKESFPNVKSVDFNGGYLYDPTEDNTDAFKQEIKNLKQHFDTLADIFNAEKLPVKSVKFSGLQTFEKKTVNDSNFAQLFQEIFGAHLSQHEVENHQASFEYTHAGIKFQVKLSLSITILKKSTGKRDRFYDAVVTIQN